MPIEPAQEVVLHLADEVALWAEILTPAIARGRPALFLDRDGVLVEEVHFLKDIDHLRISAGMAGVIRDTNAAGFPVIVVTNQSGIARGHLGWREFAEVQNEMVARLAADGARIDAVFACGYHPDGDAPFNVEHEWRKPGPGMLREAERLLGVYLKRSVIIGDRVSDLEAGLNAGLKSGILVTTGYGKENVASLEARQAAWFAKGFAASVVADPDDAVRAALKLMDV